MKPIFFVLLLLFTARVTAQEYVKLVTPKKAISHTVIPNVPDMGSLLQTILAEINLRRDTKCVAALNTSIDQQILRVRKSLGVIKNRPVNYTVDGAEYLLGVDYRNCRVISIFKNDQPALWNASTVIFRIRIFPLIQVSPTVVL